MFINNVNTKSYRNHLDCLIWLREHGCPWNPVECRNEAEHYNHRNILVWLDSIGH